MRTGQHILFKSILILSGMIMLFGLSFCRNDGSSQTEFTYLNHAPEVKYVGTEACRACHEDKYATFIQTGMGRSFDSAYAERSSARFGNIEPVYDRFRDLYYLPLLKDGSVFIKEFRLADGDTVFSRTEKIDYIIGSGHHTNSHLIEENGYLFQAPLTYYTQKGLWDLPPGFENGYNNRFSRQIGMECISCHNALPEQDKSAENRYLDMPHGIGCERCHGPGEIHVREMKKGNITDVSKTIDRTIVNPRKLEWKLQIDICQRCHLQGNAVLKPSMHFEDFRPGMVLGSVFDQFSPQYEGGDNFVMAAHAERFQMSKCFTGTVKGDLSKPGSAGFTCISCHDPHISVRQTNTLKFNNVCGSCHHTGQQKVCTDLPAKLLAAGNNCVGCHMPSSGTGDIPHVSVHDHYIRIPVATQNKPGKLTGLRCITSPEPDAQTLADAYVSYFEKFEQNILYLDKARQYAADLNPDNEHRFRILINLHYVASEFSRVITLAKNYGGAMDAWTAYRIAKAYENSGQLPEAAGYFLKALSVQSANPDFIFQYVKLLMKMNEWKKAGLELEKLTVMANKHADAWAAFGIVKLKTGHIAEARKMFEKALALDPDQLPALTNLKSIFELSGNSEKVKELERAIQRTASLHRKTGGSIGKNNLNH